MNRRSWVQIRQRLLLKVTEISFWKSYFYQKIIFHLLFVHSYLSYDTLFFIIKLVRLDWRNFIQVWWATLKYELLRSISCVNTLIWIHWNSCCTQSIMGFCINENYHTRSPTLMQICQWYWSKLTDYHINLPITVSLNLFKLEVLFKINFGRFTDIMPI